MHRLLEGFFVHNNYNEIDINIDEMKVYQKSDCLFTVVNLKDKNLTPQQFNSIMNQIYNGVKSANLYVGNNVMYLCCDDKEYIGNIVSEMELVPGIKRTISIVDTEKHMIMMEENAEDRWIELCFDISSYLNKKRAIAMEDNSDSTIDDGRLEYNSIKNSTIKQDVMKNIKYSSVHLTIINVIIFIVMNLLEVEKHSELVEMFASNGRRIIDNNEWYRLVTAMFLHSDLEHLVGNMLGLCLIGMYLEKLIGRKKFIITYFTSGIIAGLVSMGYNMYLNNNVISLGASGAIYGIYGIFIVIFIAMKHIFGKGNASRFIIYLVICGAGTMAVESIDHAAHIGGLLAGIIIGIIMYGIPRIINRNRE